jgi:hypothetical protein
MVLCYLFACLFAIGICGTWLVGYELAQGNMNRNTKWKDLNIDQWLYIIISCCMPIGIIGLLVIAS